MIQHLNRLNFLVAFGVALLTVIISIALKNIFNNNETTSPFTKRDYDLSSEPELFQIRRYCNFLDDIKIVNEDFPSDKYDLKLEKVIIMIRHGDRGPLYDVRNLEMIIVNKTNIYQKSYHDEYVLKSQKKFYDLRPDSQQISIIKDFPKDFFNFPHIYCEVNQLTKFGVLQHIKLGQLLTKIYSPKLGLFDKNSLTQQVAVHVTSYPRTFQSVLSFLHGFFYDTLNVNVFDMIPSFKKYMNIYFCDFNESYQKYCPNRNCSAIQDLRSKIYETYNHHVFRNTYQDIQFAEMVDQIKQIIAPNDDVNYETIVTVFDALNTYVCHKESLPCKVNSTECISIDQVNQIYSYLAKKGIELSHLKAYQEMSWIQITGFLHNFIDIVQDESSPQKLILFSGHDLTIQSLSSALGFSKEYFPPYASRVIFEVYHQNKESDNSKLIRVIYNGEDVTNDLTVCRFTNKCLPMAPFQSLVKFDDLKEAILSNTNLESIIQACS